MKRYIYQRVSSLAQDYEQQSHCINQHFAKHGINPESIDSIVVEKVSGTVKHTDRKLYDLIKICESGDTLYISELSRLGRNMADLFAIVNELCDKGKEEAEAEMARIKRETGRNVSVPYGVTIVQCKDGSQIENNSIAGKALLFALGLAAEIEVNNIRQRTKMGLEAKEEERRRNGHWISKAGNVCTHFGREKGCDLTKAREASTKSKQEKAALFRMNNKGYLSVKRWLAQGQTTEWILSEFNEHHKSDPENYCTMTGKPLTESTLKQWRVEIKNAVAV